MSKSFLFFGIIWYLNSIGISRKGKFGGNRHVVGLVRSVNAFIQIICG